MKNHIKILFLIIWINCLALSPSDIVYGKTSEYIQWQKLETKYTVIRYQSVEDLIKFGKKIDYSPRTRNFKHFFSSSDSDSLVDNAKMKTDALYERVQKMLDMRKQTKKVFINIYSNKNQLNTAYSKITESTYETFPRLRAWYIYENNIIYININDLHARMLAHEMAHSIIDHYLSVRPPRATAEILARYVDTHFMKETTNARK